MTYVSKSFGFGLFPRSVIETFKKITPSPPKGLGPKQASSVGLGRGQAAGFGGTDYPSPSRLPG